MTKNIYTMLTHHQQTLMGMQTTFKRTVNSQAINNQDVQWSTMDGTDDEEGLNEGIVPDRHVPNKMKSDPTADDRI